MKNKTAWVLQVMLALLFVLAGAAKFLGPMWPRLFAGWGYPSGMSAVIGVLELAGGLALLAPPTVRYAAILLGVLMIGAVVTLITHPHSLSLTTPLTYLVALGILLWLRGVLGRPHLPPSSEE